MRVFALRCLAALAAAGFAFVAAPASAQAGALTHDHDGRPYNCHHAGLIVPHYPPCGSCNNQGLFTNTWFQPAAPCGSCPQSYVAPVPTCGYVWVARGQPSIAIARTISDAPTDRFADSRWPCRRIENPLSPIPACHRQLIAARGAPDEPQFICEVHACSISIKVPQKSFG